MIIRMMRNICKKIQTGIYVFLFGFVMLFSCIPVHAQEVNFQTIIDATLQNTSSTFAGGGSYAQQFKKEWEAQGLEKEGDLYNGLYFYTMNLGDLHRLAIKDASESSYNSLFGFTDRTTGMRLGSDTIITDKVQAATESLKYLKEKGLISDIEFEKEQKRILDIVKEGAEALKEKIDQSDDSAEEKQDRKILIQAAVNEAVNASYNIADENKCLTIEELHQKYQSGCWSCLVVEKLVSTFLTVASKAYELSQRAGLTILLIGTAIWFAMWGLKNVSSLTQIDGGNILNELLKFAFKFALAYLFITSGLKMVGKYIINPIMGTGAVIAQQFWDDTSINGGTSIKDSIENYVWEDEIITPEQLDAIGKAIHDHETQQNQEITSETSVTEQPSEDAAPVEQGQVISAEDSPMEDIIRLIQNAFLSILKKQWNGIKNSCGGPCPSKSFENCRGCTCKNPGHMAYVAQIHKNAGESFGGDTPYCQASISSAMNLACDQVNGKGLLDFYNGQAATSLTANHIAVEMKLPQCIYSSGKYTGIEHGYKHVKGNPLLTTLGALKRSNKEPNIGSTLYLFKEGVNTGGSGMHAVTYLGGNQVLSFNGDSQYAIKDTDALIGIDITCVIREQLKKNPALKNKLNMAKLQELAAGNGNITFMNRTAGASGISAGSGSGGASFFNVSIPEIKYNGPTDIMSKSVMNSILGATKVITDTMAENMVLGNALTCYASLDKGGAFHLKTNWGWFSIDVGYITNGFLWLEGAIIWVAGFLLTMAVAYYLLDVCYKIGFAVIALPIVVGLWPFEMTKKKFSACISIIAKAAATFAFLAITTSYGMRMISEAIGYGGDGDGLQKIYDAMNAAFNGTGSEGDDNVQYVLEHMNLFSINFVLLMFSIIYTFKLVGATVQKLVSKFFPDNFFGEQQPMHHNLTAVTKAAKDLAMKPVGMARDIAMHQTGKLAVGAVKAAAHPVRTAKTVGNSVKKGLSKAKGIFK